MNFVHIADIHFGAMDPKLQYDILIEQFINVIEKLPIDMVTILGDLFDHKAMSNSDMIMYANKFIDQLIRRVIKPKRCTLLLLSGTYSHDNNQLKLFYHYMEDPTIDFRVIEKIQFEFVKGARVLCIPELTGLDEKIYQHYLFSSGIYDTAIMHGTIKGSVPKDEVGNGRLFTIDDFKYCRGPIYGGHVHNGKCYNSYFYYAGSPYPWTFADNNDKGFLLGIQNIDTGAHFIYKQPITSFRYETINLDFMVESNPKSIIDYIDKIKMERGIDFIRIIFTKEMSPDNKAILDSYYRNKPAVKMVHEFTKDQKIVEKQLAELEELQQYQYIFDKSLSEYDILARYINEDMNEIFISGEDIKKIIEEADI